MSNDSDVDDVPPEHPGSLMKDWFMDRRGITVSDLSAVTGLSSDEVEEIIAGSKDIDETVALKLQIMFNETAETLYRMQAEFNYFKKFGNILPYDKLPSLDGNKFYTY